MKYISLIFLSTFICLSNVQHQPERKIEYILGDEVKKGIKEAIEEIKDKHKNYKQKLTDEDFYIRIGMWEHQTLYMHVDDYDNKTINRTTIKNTNRYIQLKRKLQLPVVFDHDERLSMDYRTKDCGIIMTNNHGGKWLFTDSHGCGLKEPRY